VESSKFPNTPGTTPGSGTRPGDTNPTGTNTGFSGRQGTTGSTTGGQYGRTPGDQSTVDKAKDTAAGAVDKVKETASGAADKAKDAASNIAGTAQEAVQPRLEGQKEKAVGQLNGLADAVRQTSRQLHERDQHGLADVVDQSAKRVDRLAGYLRDRDLGQLVDDVERYSRREPSLFVGGALALGFIAARFLKSSRERAYQNRYNDYENPAYRRSAYSIPTAPSGYSDYDRTWVQDNRDVGVE
jgi:hypothetical protein